MTRSGLLKLTASVALCGVVHSLSIAQEATPPTSPTQEKVQQAAEKTYDSSMKSATITVDRRLNQLAQRRDEELLRAREIYDQQVAKALGSFSDGVDENAASWEESQREANRSAIALFNQQIAAATDAGDLVNAQGLRGRRETFIERSVQEFRAFQHRLAFMKIPPATIDDAGSDAAQPGDGAAAPDQEPTAQLPTRNLVVMVLDDDKATRATVSVNGEVWTDNVQRLNAYTSRFNLSIRADDVVTVTATDRKGGAMAFLVMDEQMRRVLNFSRAGMPVNPGQEVTTSTEPTDVPGWEAAVAVPRLKESTILPQRAGMKRQVGPNYEGIWVSSSNTGRCSAIAWPPGQ